MEFDIRPYHGCGPIVFGASRSEVRQALTTEPRPFLKSDSKIPVDAFPTLGVHVYYRESDTCEAIELLTPANPRFRGERLLGRAYSELRNALLLLDSDAREDEAGLISHAFGLGLYAPYCRKHPDDPVEAVIVFARGYYDR